MSTDAKIRELEAKVWDTMCSQLEALESDSNLGKLVLGNDTQGIGVSLSALLIEQMLEVAREGSGNPCGALLGLTDSEIAAVSLNQPSHEERMLASRMAGRFFIRNLKQPLHYIVQSTPVWISGKTQMKSLRLCLLTPAAQKQRW